MDRRNRTNFDAFMCHQDIQTNYTMATASIDDTQDNNRISNVIYEPLKMLMSIEGFENKSLVSLEEAIQPLTSIVPDIQRKVWIAKERCANPSDHLTCDQSAAIMLYTIEWSSYKDSLYYILNATLRDENRENLKPWFLYLKLIFTALDRLPSINNHTIYLTVKCNIGHLYPQDKVFVWWGFSSCIKTFDSHSNSTEVRTLFTIRCDNAKDIRRHSYIPSDNEILILPATQFQVIAQYPPVYNTQVIQIKEIKPTYPLLRPHDHICRKSVISTSNKNPRISQIGAFESRSKIELTFQNLIDDDMNIIVNEAIIKKQCKELRLDDNEITSKGVYILAKILHSNYTLKGLYLARNRVFDTGVMYLAKVLSKKNSTLRELDLASNRITDIGAEYLANMLKTNSSLTSLGLSENNINNRGMKLLMKTLADYNTTLQVLYLDSNAFKMNSIIDYMINMLKYNQSLTKLYLGNCCDMSETCKEKLGQVIESKKHFILHM